MNSENYYYRHDSHVFIERYISISIRFLLLVLGDINVTEHERYFKNKYYTQTISSQLMPYFVCNKQGRRAQNLTLHGTFLYCHYFLNT